MGLADKKPRPTKEISHKLFAGSGPTTGRPSGAESQPERNFGLKNKETGLVHTSDVFSGNKAFSALEKSAPVVDWEAMAAHARQAAHAPSFAEIFGRGGRLEVINRPLLIALVSGIIGGILVSIFAYYTDRIPYRQYSERGAELLRQKEARPAVEYFLSQSNRMEQETWSGSPNHIASLEGLAEAYARDNCYTSAEDTFKKEIRLLLKAPFRDNVRLVSALELYSDFLRERKNDLGAKAIAAEVKRLKDQNTGGHWIWFFAIIAFAFEALYMTGVMLGGKKRIEHWQVYAGFSVMGMLGMTVGMFMLGLPIWGSLALAMFLAYALMPIVLGASCALGKNLPAFHIIAPSTKRK